MPLPDIRSIPSLQGRRVIVRSSVNVPLDADGVVANDFRLRRMLPTLTYVRESGGTAIVIGHIGREHTATLRPVHEWFCRKMGIAFAETIGEVHELLQEGAHYAVLLENLRQHDGEYENSQQFATELAALGDTYVNDAFAASHREHASIVGIPPLLPSFAGIQFKQEVDELSDARNPVSPSMAILAGAKFETKLPLACALLERYDYVVLAGALAHPVLAARGYGIGTSLMPDDTESIQACVKELADSRQVLLPSDVVVSAAGDTRTITPDALQSDDRIVDAGPETVDNLAAAVQDRATVLWNGPLGAYENGYVKPTEQLARALGDSHATVTVGGGDTVAVLDRIRMLHAYNFVSTAGGAMLAFLKDGTLPGIEALNARERITENV